MTKTEAASREALVCTVMGNRGGKPTGRHSHLIADSTECNSAFVPAGDWTIAYRKPRANRFQRVTNWSGTWHQAFELAGIFAKANPDLQVYYVPSADYERREFVGLNKRVDTGQVTREYAVSMIEDHGNVLVEETNRRVKIHETGVLSAEMLALVPDAAEAKARFERDAI